MTTFDITENTILSRAREKSRVLGSVKASARGICLGRGGSIIYLFFFLVKLSARETTKREKVLFSVCMST